MRQKPKKRKEIRRDYLKDKEKYLDKYSRLEVAKQFQKMQLQEHKEKLSHVHDS